jgi:hypothetical protein
MGELEKLKIVSYKDAAFSEQDTEFTVMFNPSTYNIKHEVEYKEDQGIGTTASALKFSKIKPQDLKLDFIFDGTGVTGSTDPVEDQIGDFLSVAHEYKGNEHRPRFLKLVWGTLMFRCVLKSADITYNLFKPDGKPLRAKISASFSGFMEDERRTSEERSASPDLSHIVTVKEGDTLPLLTYKIYGDSSWYMEVARVNRLRSFRHIKAGDILHFPPVDRSKVKAV